MDKFRKTLIGTAAGAVLLTAGVAPAQAATGAAQPSTGRDYKSISGVCGSLLATGVSVASLGKTIASKGAGWVGAIVSAGCLVKDTKEYSKAFNASPAGIARLKKIQAKYHNYTFEHFMKDFGCKFVANPPGGGTDLAPRAAATKASGHWDCSSAGD
ncbi:hypothetical protein J7F01_33420 [Streptomyces sp. ISL-22]|uniref:Secreted protein n=1 Tax=Streptomyces curacoi TaxID=146536 RepID=A0A117P0R0_9ACTN|nr:MULTISPECIES: hypothetical protein [Streptomyces]KUM70933.1 hypothetical protein AQI70_29845 [Streptomyces curacoi]MBT2421603.1 hypothetical protein [Streptomyces sp. ISL-24]MBT2436971.1 hypothetical protein [Streptomyces sp. ISL-22]